MCVCERQTETADTHPPICLPTYVAWTRALAPTYVTWINMVEGSLAKFKSLSPGGLGWILAQSFATLDSGLIKELSLSPHLSAVALNEAVEAVSRVQRLAHRKHDNKCWHHSRAPQIIEA